MIEILKRYAELKILEKQAKEELAELNPKIIQYLVESDLDKQPTTLGTFSLRTLKDWEYSNAVKVAKKTVKDLESKEQKDGTATFTEKLSLMFKESKENE